MNLNAHIKRAIG